VSVSSVDKAVTVDLTETPHAASPANSTLYIPSLLLSVWIRQLAAEYL